MPTTYLWFLFDWRGRIGRKAYRLALLALLLVDRSRDLVPDEGVHAGFAMLAIALVISMALDAKRLHDLGISAIWIPVTTAAAAVALWAAPALLGIDASAMEAAMREIGGRIGADDSLVSFAATALSLAALVRGLFLSTLQGQARPNRYDFDPRQSAPLDVPDDAVQQMKVDALIAAALAEKAKAAKGPIPAGERPVQPARKSFGRRGMAA
jgi:uncharacterized membrane protein YhaH (DUF805 family)